MAAESEALKIGELLEVLEGHAGDVNSTAWSPAAKDTLCSCSGDKKIRVWKIDGSTPPRKPTPVETIAAHELYINSCAFNPSGDLLVTTSSDETVKIWSTVSWTCVGELSLHDASVRDCSFSQDGNLLASVSDDTTVLVWEVGAMRCISTITKHSEGVTCCQFAPNGWLLATGASNGQFLLFDVFTGECVAKKRIGPAAHDGGINTIAVQPLPLVTPTVGGDGGEKEAYQFATAGNDNLIKLWKVECDGVVNGKRSVAGAMLAELTKHTGPVYSCAYHPSLPFLATGSRDKSVILWNTVLFTAVQQISAHSRYVTHVSIAPSGSFLATASNDRTVKVWALKSAAECETDADRIALRASWNTPGNSCSLPQKSYSEESRSESTALPKKPSNISTVGWSVDDVCKWAESVAKQQNTPGVSTHPDDVRAASRLMGLLEQVSLSSGDRRKAVGDDFKCPITCEVMRDPVVASDGYSYERSAITGWLSKGRRTSPVTNLPLPSTLLLPNKTLKIAIDREKQQSAS